MRAYAHIPAPDRRGVSLMETLVVIGVMAVLLLLIAQIFSLNYDIYAKQTARLDADTGAVFAARSISNLARGASRVVDSWTINGTLYTTSADAVVLRVPSIDASGNIIDATFDYIAIYRDAVETTKIFADTQADAVSSRATGKRLVTAYNDTMRFTYNAPDASDATRVGAFLINTQTVRGSTFRSKAWTSLFLRNK